MLVGYPNTRKREEALVGAYFGIYDGSLTFETSKGEYFGQFDDGTSYIANNRQIENGIAAEIAPAVHAAVKAGIREVLSEMPIGGTGDVYLDGVKVTREVMSTANKISKSTGATWRMA